MAGYGSGIGLENGCGILLWRAGKNLQIRITKNFIMMAQTARGKLNLDILRIIQCYEST